MPNFTAQTKITLADGSILEATKKGDYNESFNVRQIVDNTDTGILSLFGTEIKGLPGTIPAAASIIIKNAGITGIELLFSSYTNTAGTPDVNSDSLGYWSYLLGVGEHIYFPSLRQSSYSAATSAANAYTLNNQAPHSDMYVAVTNVNGADAQLLAEDQAADEPDIDVDEGGYYYVGDLIRIEDEIMEVTAVNSNTLTVIKGVHGSTSTSHNDDDPIRFPFFNKYTNFTAATGGYDTVQTNDEGLFWCTNFFGYGRNTDTANNPEANGIVGGSVSGKFYSAAYQGFGLKNIKSSTSSGLAVSTAYGFDLTIDGGSVLDDAVMTFTTDSSNVNWGGTNGIIEKIQEVLDTQFATTSSAINGKKVSIGIVNGDIRITSESHLSTSAVLIGAGDGTPTTPFGVGAVPAIAKIGSPVASALPPDEILNPVTGISYANVDNFFWDDGHGNITSGKNLNVTGTINVTTGEMKLAGCPPNAHFVVSANYGSMHSGGNRFLSGAGNSIYSVAGRSVNSKIDGIAELIGLN